jgi:NADH pyrophosphatase NudC (nudix superfamily)
MEYEGGDVADHDWEVDSASWFQIDEALKKVNYKSEKELLEKARKKINTK